MTGEDSGDYARAVEQRNAVYDKVLQGAADATRKWLDASEQSRGKHVDGFTIASEEDDGIAAVHDATGLRTTFNLVGGRLEWASREYRPVDIPPEMSALKVVIHRELSEDGESSLWSDLAGERGEGANTRFSARNAEEETTPQEAWLEVVDDAYGHSYTVDATAVLVRHQVWMDGGVGRLLYDVTRPGEDPEVVDVDRMPSQDWSARLLDGGRVALVRFDAPVDSIEHLQVDGRTGRLLKETVTIRDKRRRTTGYWEIDHQLSSAVRLDGAGRPVAQDGSSRASVVVDHDGGLKLLSEPDSTLLFERRPVGDVTAHHTLPVGRESFVFPVGFADGDRMVRVDAPLGEPEALRLVDQRTGERIDVPVDFSQDFGLTVDVVVPDARNGARARYTFTRSGRPRSEKLPLLGGQDTALGDLRLVVRHTSEEPELALGGSDTALERFRIGPVPEDMEGGPEAEFTVTDSETGMRYHYSRGARAVAQDMPLSPGPAGERVLNGRDPLFLRLGANRKPQLVGDRMLLAEDLVLRTEVRSGGRMAVIRTDTAGREEARLVVDTASRRVLEETVAVPRERAGLLGYGHWQLDFQTGTAVRLGMDGKPRVAGSTTA